MTEKHAIEKLLFLLQSKSVISNTDETQILKELQRRPKEKSITIARSDKGYHCNAIVPEDRLEEFLELLGGILKK